MRSLLNGLQVSNYGRWRSVHKGKLQPPRTPTPAVDEEYVYVKIEGKPYHLATLVLCAFEKTLPSSPMSAVRASKCTLPTATSPARTFS